MKRAIAVLLTLFICAEFSACNYLEGDSIPKTDETTQTSVNIPTTPSENEGNVMQMPMYSISLPITEQCEYAADGTVLFNYRYQNIALIGPEPDIADAVIVDLLNQIDDTVTDAERIKECAMEDYKIREFWSPYFYEVIYQPMRLDQAVLCLYGRNMYYSGGAHSMVSFKSTNYDLTNGNILKLTDILIDDSASKPLCNAVIDVLSQIEEAENLYPGYEDFVIERFNKPLDKDRNWYLDSNGLTFHFSPYEIGPYSIGDVQATILYKDLVGILKEAYFPLETDTASGEVFAINFTDEACAGFSQFSEIILSENGNKFIIYADSYVRNVTLYTGSWDDANGAFTGDIVVYYANNLTPGDAIMVQCELNAQIPTLYLTYTSNGEDKNCYIMLNKQTHNVNLIK